MKQLKLTLIQPDAKKGVMVDYLTAIKAGYRLLSKEDIIIYNPNCVSRRVRILSA